MNLVQTAMAASERIFDFLEIGVEENPYEEKIEEITDEISFENNGIRRSVADFDERGSVYDIEVLSHVGGDSIYIGYNHVDAEQIYRK